MTVRACAVHNALSNSAAGRQPIFEMEVVLKFLLESTRLLCLVYFLFLPGYMDAIVNPH